MASFGTRLGGIAVCFACLASGSFVACAGALLPNLSSWSGKRFLCFSECILLLWQISAPEPSG